MRKKDKSVIFRLEAHIYEHLQALATELGLSMSEYQRLMACWPFAYLLIATEARQIVQSSEDPEMAAPLLRNAVSRIDTRLAQMDELIGKIQATAPLTQQQSRDQLLGLRTQLQGQLEQFQAVAVAFRTVRKRLGEPPEAGKEIRWP
jgi:hypothetical protein